MDCLVEATRVVRVVVSVDWWKCPAQVQDRGRDPTVMLQHWHGRLVYFCDLTSFLQSPLENLSQHH